MAPADMEIRRQEPQARAGTAPVVRLPPWWLIVAAGAIAAGALLVVHAVNELVGVSAVLTLDNENGLAGWYSATQFYAAGVVAALVALVERRARMGWLVVAAAFLAFSLDDLVQVHEATEAAADSRYSFLGLQPLIAIAVSLALVATGRRMDGAAAKLLAAAAAALWIALLASIASALIDRLPKLVFLALSGTEEAAEMMMATLVIAAALDRASRLTRIVRTP